jgi:hypothetical protein
MASTASTAVSGPASAPAGRRRPSSHHPAAPSASSASTPVPAAQPIQSNRCPPMSPAPGPTLAAKSAPRRNRHSEDALVGSPQTNGPDRSAASGIAR